jgi:outer membrane lipoprotein-sorting protein
VAAPVQAQTSDAKSILKASLNFVASHKAIELTFGSDIEIVTPQMEKIQFTNSGEVLLIRPDKLRAHRVGGYADVTLYFDGQTASAYSDVINGRMIAGLAMVANPDAYGETGVMTFIVSHNGKIYEKDLGKKTDSIGAQMAVFDPGAGWKEVAP